jgi:hypothetical protein
MAYAAYLRIYEPVSAFHEPDRSRWVAYAASSTRPRRRDSLAVEHAEALRRAINTPWVAVPERESEHAYVRRVDGTTYVCPWQTRLRCLLAYGQMRSESGTGPARLHIMASIWTVPLTWFVPFTPAERWLSLGDGRGRAGTAPTVSATRAVGDLAEVGRWLEDFHPYSLVELDYGGLVHLVSDDALCSDQSVAEIRAAIDGAARDECEVAVAMYMRARDRWRAFAEFEQAN